MAFKARDSVTETSVTFEKGRLSLQPQETTVRRFPDPLPKSRHARHHGFDPAGQFSLISFHLNKIAKAHTLNPAVYNDSVLKHVKPPFLFMIINHFTTCKGDVFV